MRYSEGPTAEVDVYIDATPAVVWALVSDITVPVRYSEELVDARWADSAVEPGVGCRFVGRSEHPARGTWETTSVVVDFQPEGVFAWDVESPEGVSASWRFEVEPEGTGTRLRQTGRMGPAPSGLSIAIAARPDKEERIVERRLDEWRRNMAANLDGIKALAEAPRG